MNAQQVPTTDRAAREPAHRSFSLRAQLIAVIAGVVATLVVFMLTFFPSQMQQLSQTWVERRAAGMSMVLSKAASAGVEFDDESNVSELLSGMSAAPGIMYAKIERADGSTLAEWSRGGAVLSPEKAAWGKATALVERGLLHARTPVTAQGGTTATLFMGFALDELEHENREQFAVAMSFSALVFLLGVVLSFIIGTVLARPIGNMSVVALQIAEGNLADAERALGGRDEVERVAGSFGVRERHGNEVRHLRASFARMLIALKETSATLQESAGLLTHSVTHLTASAAEQSDNITRQAAALEQTRVTAEEIRQSSVTTSQKAHEVLQVAERADEVSRSGEANIERSIKDFTGMREQVYQVALHINQLAERSREIGVITQTVKDFADQSNMLAVNAAIEAVRTGEHGRGFAVVAKEIRSLADQSVKATVRVREVLQVVVDETKKTVNISEHSARDIDRGLTKIQTSGESIRELAEIVKGNCGSVRQIASAVQQQSAGVGQLFAAVKELSAMMDGTVQQIEATDQAVQVVASVSKRVSDIAKRYRI